MPNTESMKLLGAAEKKKYLLEIKSKLGLGAMEANVNFIIKSISTKIVHSIFLSSENEMNQKNVNFLISTLEDISQVLTSEEVWLMGKLFWREK